MLLQGCIELDRQPISQGRDQRTKATAQQQIRAIECGGSEIMQAQHDGYTELKFFPAMQAGGVAMLKALYGPFSHIQFCPTGGITAQNAGEFLALPNVACVGGSWLVPAEALVQADYARIETLARQTAKLGSQNSVSHPG